jgi:hypothetical protein
MIRRVIPSIEALLHRSTNTPGKIGHVDISGGFHITVGKVRHPHDLDRNRSYRRRPIRLRLDSKYTGRDKRRAARKDPAHSLARSLMAVAIRPHHRPFCWHGRRTRSLKTCRGSRQAFPDETGIFVSDDFVVEFRQDGKTRRTRQVLVPAPRRHDVLCVAQETTTDTSNDAAMMR